MLSSKFLFSRDAINPPPLDWSLGVRAFAVKDSKIKSIIHNNDDNKKKIIYHLGVCD